VTAFEFWCVRRDDGRDVTAIAYATSLDDALDRVILCGLYSTVSPYVPMSDPL
jgi:hypothetical protein